MRYNQTSSAGYGTLAAMIILATIVTLVGSALSFTSTFARQANRQRSVLQAEEAADSALEYAYATWTLRTTPTLRWRPARSRYPLHSIQPWPQRQLPAPASLLYFLPGN